MKEWFLGRGQTLIALAVVVGLVWGLVSIILKLPKDGGDTVTTLSTVLIGVVTSLIAVVVALGKSVLEPAKNEEKKNGS